LGVPANTVSFITGKGGSFLRLVEEEWCTLLFFLRLDPARPPQRANPLHVESLAIFGPERRRWGAQLKVMAAIEMKVMGYFTQTVGDHESLEDGFAIDTVRIREEDYSYALGKNGSTRKKLAKASGCTVEYVGRVAYLCGVRSERGRAREYLRWRLCQRAGERVHIDHRGRSDVTVVMVGAATAGFIAGQRGALLHAIEERTGTLCFFEGGGAAAPRQSSEEGPRPLLIFGRPEHRRAAEAEVWDRIIASFEQAGAGLVEDARGVAAADWGPKTAKSGGGVASRGLTGLDPGPHEERVEVPHDVASLLLGGGGRDRRRIARASGATLDLRGNTLVIAGTREERRRAAKYVHLLRAQLLDRLPLGDACQHDDLTLVRLPEHMAEWTATRQDAFLRGVEEEFRVLTLAADPRRCAGDERPTRTLAVFGALGERRGAELKVLAAIESKVLGYIAKRDEEKSCHQGAPELTGSRCSDRATA